MPGILGTLGALGSSLNQNVFQPKIAADQQAQMITLQRQQQQQAAAQQAKLDEVSQRFVQESQQAFLNADKEGFVSTLQKFQGQVPPQLFQKMAFDVGGKLNEVIEERNKQAAPKTVSPGQSLVDPKTGQPVFTAPKEQPGFSLSPGQTRFDAQDRPVASVAQPEARGGQGTPVVLAGGTAQGGLQITPETPTGEIFSHIVQVTGKRVPDGMSKRMEEHDIAMAQLNAMTDQIKKNINLFGAVNKLPLVSDVRSMMSTDFASLRAQTDAFRQAFGRSMEGGVLRKEDEVKYMRIAPTINDTPEQANAKLQVAARLVREARLLYAQNIISGLTGEQAVVSYEQLNRAMNGVLDQVSTSAPTNAATGASGGAGDTTMFGGLRWNPQTNKWEVAGASTP